MKEKIYYYHDLKNDDFAKPEIEPKVIPDSYRFIKVNPISLLFELLIRLVATPIIWLMLKVIYLHKFKNRKVLLKAAGKGYFIYGNHTNCLLDAYTPTLLAFPRLTHIIVNPAAVSIKGLGEVVRMLGAIPIPASVKGMKRYYSAIKRLNRWKHVIAIYPEAHIWPYYTDIRPFGKESFHYAVDTNAPSFSYTSIYVKRKIPFIKFPKVVTYIDGPFYPDNSLPKQERIQKLRDEVYLAMKKRVDEHPKYEYAKYIYVENENETNSKVGWKYEKQ